jgi:hypothetical protein
MFSVLEFGIGYSIDGAGLRYFLDGMNRSVTIDFSLPKRSKDEFALNDEVSSSISYQCLRKFAEGGEFACSKVQPLSSGDSGLCVDG